MRELPHAMRQQLQDGAATLCLCWRITPRAAPPLGFTNHDRDIVFDGLTFRAASGFSASDAESALGLAVDNMDIAGALSSADLREEDLAAGVYDSARVDLWLVDWRDPQLRYLLRRGTLGRIRRGKLHFEAEIRGLAAQLEQTRGRIFAYGCDAALGDARCKVDLDEPAWKGAGVVARVRDGRVFTVTGLEGFAPEWFVHGRLTWTSGINAARTATVKAHETLPGGARLKLWQPLPEPPAVGDAFTITAGCDGHFATCREKFANAVNYRGFPHMPGNDFIIRYPNRDDASNDGSTLITD